MKTKKMKTKYISILLFIFVFGGVLLLGATTTRADWKRDCAGTVEGECISNIGPWTLKAFVGCRQIGDETNTPYSCTNLDSEEIPVVLGGSWPIHDEGNERTVFRYITGLTYTTTKVSNQSYVVFNWPTIPLGGDPPGAQLSLSALYADCGTTVPEQRIAWKLNRKSKEAILNIYMPLYTEVDTKCGSAWIKWSSSCMSGGPPLWVAKGNVPMQTTRIFTNCAGAEVTVTFDECSGLPQNPSIKYVGSTSPDSCHKALSPELCFDDPSNPANCFQDINLGPRGSGALICTYPPVYVYGVDAWFCPLP